MGQYTALILLATGGALGGVVTCVISNEYATRYDKTAGLIQLGLPGSVVIGAVAAFVIWAVYGPIAGESVIASVKPIDITWVQLGTSILTGMCGSQILTQMAQKNSLIKGRDKMLENLNEAGADAVEAPTNTGEDETN